MFLTAVRSGKNYYVYLNRYKVREYYVSNKETLFAFGRNEKAIKKMYQWQSDFSSLPKKLSVLGCDRMDLKEWIDTLETGITKTGRNFSGAL